MSTENCLEHQIIITEDGSPSLKPLHKDSEGMHNLKGAFTESLYIYGEAALAAGKFHGDLTIASVGLGIGYNEIISYALAVSHKISIRKLYSFEKLPLLRQAFAQWINSEESQLAKVYNTVLKMTAQYFQIQPQDLKEKLQQEFREERLILLDSWPPHNFSDPFNCIYFDAYSSKTSPELWTEESLTKELTQHTQKQCLLSTYAATGALHRSLKTCGFELKKRAGFAGKRQSTWAIKSF